MLFDPVCVGPVGDGGPLGDESPLGPVFPVPAPPSTLTTLVGSATGLVPRTPPPDKDLTTMAPPIITEPTPLTTLLLSD